MLSWIREKFGTVVIGGIISFIAFVFVFYGVFSPKSTRGLHEGAVAGTVNGDPISIADFNRELNRRIEFFKNIAGGKISDEQLKAFRIREGVFQELANRKMMVQEAQRQGLGASDEEVKEKIQEIPAFQKEGKFDLATYKQVLEANGHTAGSFERLVREDLLAQQWDKYFQERSLVSDAEVKQEFLLKQDQRNLKYVLLTTESAQKNVQITPAEIQAFLADAPKMNIAKLRFEEGKDTLYKGQKFETAKENVVRSILASQKLEEAQKINQKLAEQVSALLQAGKANDAKVNALVKASGAEVKTTGWISAKTTNIPGLGDIKEILKDSFAAKSPIDSQQNGKAKVYSLAGRTIIALVVESKHPDLASLPKEKPELMKELSQKKSRELYTAWLKKLSKESKIDMNPAVVGADG